MGKILGLDMGTNSIGWAIVEQGEADYKLLDRGVQIFQEGVARDKSSEKPAVQDRTDARALRRHYFRRRLRKIELLKVLIRHELCPTLTDEQLEQWKSRKVYPLTDEFLKWQRTDEISEKNPYRDRYRALTETLDLERQKDRYTLGRALYHLSQRRGFLSNRNDTGNEAEDGKVRQAIQDLSADMADAGCEYLGEYFYELYRRKEKIRKKYTSRNEHYLKEFRAICERQQLPAELSAALHRAIFFQRDLKSQKGAVGKCCFEPRKRRCPLSHPRFEEFRMWTQINSIRVTGPDDREPRMLTREEVEAIRPLFMRKSKPHFDFEEIAAKIAGKGRDAVEAPWRFNYPAGFTVSGCRVTAPLRSIFGEEWQDALCRTYALAEGKTPERIVNDVWHALKNFKDDDKLRAWACEKLRLSDEAAENFAAIRLPQGYASLSLNAIDKMLPLLRRGYRYDEAAFMANLEAVLPDEVHADEAKRKRIEADIAALMEEYRDGRRKKPTKEEAVSDYLRNFAGAAPARLRRLYHPTMGDRIAPSRPDAQGMRLLGSPRTESVRNPMAMRALFRLRALVNELLREKKIAPDTGIRIELSRNLSDANRRKAIEQYQREREAEHRAFAEEIGKHLAAATGQAIEPTEDEVMKYRLWKEQKHICLYTGNQIALSDFLGAAPRYDIEHTLPRARGGDDSQRNKTLCERHYNRHVKGNKLPSELPSHADILARIEAIGWPEQIERLHRQIEGAKRKSALATTKDEKDAAMQRRHYLRMQLDDLRGKYERFLMTEVPEGFGNRQGVDIGIIGKYARLYLKTVFERVETVKGETTHAFRQMWGLQQAFAPKERVDHVHHCIDAITIACIGRNEYDRWARYAADEERYERGEDAKPAFPKPWPTFTQDVAAAADELLVAHHTPDNLPRQSRKRLRVRGKIQKNKHDEPIYRQGDTARGPLHLQTFYGAIRRDDEIRYVVRKSLAGLQPADVEKIVDDTVRQRVREAIAEHGFKQATDPDSVTIWMNREKGVPVRKVRIYAGAAMSPKPLGEKRHRDASVHPHKNPYYVAYGSNYCMALYEGTGCKGKTKRSFEIVSTLEAAQYFKASADRTARPDLVPRVDAKGYPLRCILKTGILVLFYEKTPDELNDCTPKELERRLYKLTKFSSMNVGNNRYGTLVFRHHREARATSELKPKNGIWKAGEAYRPLIALYHTQLNALIEGYDFRMTVAGKIVFNR